MSAAGINTAEYEAVKTIAREHNATVQEVVSTLLRLQLDSLSDLQLQNLAFRQGRKPRSPSKRKKVESSTATAVAVSSENASAFVGLDDASDDDADSVTA